jgi:hypothetical protein
MLSDYAGVTRRIIPVTADLLKPLLSDMEFKLRPGTLLLTWSSITIDHFRSTVWEALDVRLCSRACCVLLRADPLPLASAETENNRYQHQWHN